MPLVTMPWISLPFLALSGAGLTCLRLKILGNRQATIFQGAEAIRLFFETMPHSIRHTPKLCLGLISGDNIQSVCTYPGPKCPRF